MGNEEWEQRNLEKSILTHGFSLLFVGMPFDDAVGVVDAKFTSLAEVGYAFELVVGLDIGESPVVVGFCQVGVEFHGVGVAVDGSLIVSLLEVVVAEVVVEVWVLGVELDGSFEVEFHFCRCHLGVDAL